MEEKKIRSLLQGAELLQLQHIPIENRLRQLAQEIMSGGGWSEGASIGIEIEGVLNVLEGAGRGDQSIQVPLELKTGGTGKLTLFYSAHEELELQWEENKAFIERLGRMIARAVDCDRTLRRQEKVIESLDDAVLIIQEGKEKRVVTEVNPAAERIFGYKKDELVGETTEKLHRNYESFVKFGEKGDPILYKKGFFRASYPMRRADGKVFQSEQLVVLLEPRNGISGGAVSIVRDLSSKQKGFDVKLDLEKE